MDFAIVFIAKYFYLLAIAIAAVLFFVQQRKTQRSMIVCGAIVAPLAYVISRIASHFYYNPRPFVVGHFIPLMAHAADNGFPSDHVLLVGAIAMIIWFYDRKISAALWLIALLIGWARVASGIHHAADIAGSIVIVLFSGVVYYLAARQWRL
ncbi:MAG TPA: phosphatase PAP2 family protein [Candidatus Paceibacterota bacterium]|nr:phosphatase PAP2 family protein [Candidatus Paceibacterota bacterium]